MGAYEYADERLVSVQLRHQTGGDAARWVDVTSHRVTEMQPRELLEEEGLLRARRSRLGSLVEVPGVTILATIVVDGHAQAATFTRYGPFELAVIHVQPVADGIGAVVVIERGGPAGEAISLVRVSDFTEYLL
jgi:hypothetical protein